MATTEGSIRVCPYVGARGSWRGAGLVETMLKPTFQAFSPQGGPQVLKKGAPKTDTRKCREKEAPKGAQRPPQEPKKAHKEAQGPPKETQKAPKGTQKTPKEPPINWIADRKQFRNKIHRWVREAAYWDTQKA